MASEWEADWISADFDPPTVKGFVVSPGELGRTTAPESARNPTWDSPETATQREVLRSVVQAVFDDLNCRGVVSDWALLVSPSAEPASFEVPHFSVARWTIYIEIRGTLVSWADRSIFVDGIRSIVPLDEVVEIAEWMQELYMEETRLTVPPCPAHPHPVTPIAAEGYVGWFCPTNDNLIAKLGEVRVPDS